MRPLDLTRVGDELYSLPPDSFIAARDGFAQQARDAGDTKLAAAVKKLRRPTVSAWLVNQLTRQAGDDIAELLRLGESLREAQHELAGARLRDLSAQRRGLVGALTQTAQRIAADAGQPLGAQARREVATTLEAALADPAAAELVRGRRLTIPLSFVGLGAQDVETPIELGAAVRSRQAPAARRTAGQPEPGRAAGEAVAMRRQRGPGEAGAGRPAAGAAATGRQQLAREAAAREAAAQQAAREAAAAERAAREAATAKRDLRDASEHVQQAEVALDESERRVHAHRAERDDARSLVTELEAQLAEAHTAEGHAIRDLRDAQRHRDLMARSLASAQRRLAQAWARASKHR